eukprot:2575102-Prymnesium_polylepis.1
MRCSVWLSSGAVFSPATPHRGCWDPRRSQVQLLSEADAIVGGISTFSRLAVRLGAAARGAHAVPYVDVGMPTVRRWLDERTNRTREEAAGGESGGGGGYSGGDDGYSG